jgi:hypothetical protein
MLGRMTMKFVHNLKIQSLDTGQKSTTVMFSVTLNICLHWVKV